MKKTILLFLLIILISSLQNGLNSRLYAADMSAGVSTWYAWWKTVDSKNQMDLKPTLLYGPALSVSLMESWSLSGVFLYGQFKPAGDAEYTPDKISRTDSDVSLNYNITRYFKIFGGGKYMGFKWDERYTTGTHWSAGPGLGIGTTLPLTDFLYLLVNLSGTYSWGKHEQENMGENNQQNKTTISINELGANTNITLAYYIKSASTSVNLGFRYQYFNIDYATEGEGYQDEGHYFIGATLAVIYSFSI